MTNKGLFISLEGVDGSGKSSIVKELAKRLQEDGHKVLLTREPGGSPLAEEIRELILRNDMLPRTEALLFFAARHDHYHKTIVPAVENGQIVISDRFIYSSVVYQGQCKDLVREVNVLDREFLDRVRPDLTLVIDVDIETSKKRMKDRGAMDRFDSASDATLRLIRESFLNIAAMSTNVVKVENNGELQDAVDTALFFIKRKLEQQ